MERRNPVRNDLLGCQYHYDDIGNDSRRGDNDGDDDDDGDGDDQEDDH